MTTNMKWHTGNWSSAPEDGRAYLEARETTHKGQVVKVWHVYKTGPDGGLLEGFPRLTKQPFYTLSRAQKWVLDNVEPR